MFTAHEDNQELFCEVKYATQCCSFIEMTSCTDGAFHTVTSWRPCWISSLLISRMSSILIETLSVVCNTLYRSLLRLERHDLRYQETLESLIKAITLIVQEIQYYLFFH